MKSEVFLEHPLCTNMLTYDGRINLYFGLVIYNNVLNTVNSHFYELFSFSIQLLIYTLNPITAIAILIF